jgi:hypothetical protein
MVFGKPERARKGSEKESCFVCRINVVYLEGSSVRNGHVPTVGSNDHVSERRGLLCIEPTKWLIEVTRWQTLPAKTPHQHTSLNIAFI